jgi:hypothetical protein
MPPQQSERPLDLVDDIFNLSAHGSSIAKARFRLSGTAGCSDWTAATQPALCDPQ